MIEGWIKLHRQIVENELWLSEPFTRAQAWVDLLLIANHTDGMIRRRGIKIVVKRGQVGMSQDSLAERWRWSKNKVRRFLKELIGSSQIDMKTELKNIAISTLITITKYELYQGNGTENETKEKPKTKLKTAPEQECKEGKEEKEENQNNMMIPEWIPRAAFFDFIEHRKDMKKPMTERAAQLLIGKLEKFKAKGHDIEDILKESVINNWQGVFEPKGVDHEHKDELNERRKKILAGIVD